MKHAVVVIAKVKVKPEGRAAFIAAAQHCTLATRTESGCFEYDFYESQTEANTFVFVEQWSDRAAIDAHFLAPHLQELMRVAGSTLADVPRIVAITPADVASLV